jgi:serine/threonine protein kinase
MARSDRSITFETAFNSYVQIREIGEGGAGTVVCVNDQEGRTFALKYLSPRSLTTQKVKRFKNELAFCEKNRHPNILTVIDHGYITLKGKKCPFYVMPHYEATLRDLMTAKILPNHVLPLFGKILDGVEAAHKQSIWHRDLKPENILCNTTRDHLVVADFGIAHFEEDFLLTAVETKPGDRLANFMYAAPEQRSKAAEVDHRADIFALGVILNEMFTGSPPQGQGYKTIADAAAEYSYLDELVSQMRMQEPDKRPSCVDDIKKRLIAMGNAFVTRQKLNALRDTVIPTSEVDDLLVLQPVQLQSFEIDYENGMLILKLTKPANSVWIECFQQIPPDGGIDFVSLNREYSPNQFTFNRDSATIPIQRNAKTQQVQGIIDCFKTYLTEATDAYRIRLTESQRKKEHEENIALQRRIAEEERREAILRGVKL